MTRPVFVPPRNLYESEERLHRARREHRMLLGLMLTYKREYRQKGKNIALLPEISRLAQRLTALKCEIEDVRAWYKANAAQQMRRHQVSA